MYISPYKEEIHTYISDPNNHAAYVKDIAEHIHGKVQMTIIQFSTPLNQGLESVFFSTIMVLMHENLVVAL